jgi:integrase/recombinase XerD
MMESSLELVPTQSEILPIVPAPIGREGERASWRFLEFFTVHIRNLNTRAAYTHAAELFLS